MASWRLTECRQTLSNIPDAQLTALFDHFVGASLLQHKMLADVSSASRL
jgi:hypothetical protein